MANLASNNQFLSSPTIRQQSTLLPGFSPSSAQITAFPTPCLSSRGSSFGRLAFAMFFLLLSKFMGNRRQFLSYCLITGSPMIWVVDMLTTIVKPPFGTSSNDVSKGLSATSATFTASALACIYRTTQPK